MPLTAGSLVLTILQQDRAGVYVQSRAAESGRSRLSATAEALTRAISMQSRNGSLHLFSLGNEIITSASAREGRWALPQYSLPGADRFVLLTYCP